MKYIISLCLLIFSFPALGEALATSNIQTDYGDLRISVSGDQMPNRKLTIWCARKCTGFVGLSEKYADYPISILRLSDASQSVCVLGSTGSGISVKCYSVDLGHAKKVYEQSAKQLVDVYTSKNDQMCVKLLRDEQYLTKCL